jgi:hypothetical protein
VASLGGFVSGIVLTPIFAKSASKMSTPALCSRLMALFGVIFPGE